MKRKDWSLVLRKAGNAGRKAILRNYTETSRHKILGKGMGGDMTLRIDEVSERAIYNSLKSNLGKEFVFLSEEIGEVSKIHNEASDVPIVVCDPLDGSHNAEVGIPLFSLALSVIEPNIEVQTSPRAFGNIVAGLITSIKTDDEFVASKGKGSFHNGKKMKPSRVKTSHLIRTLLIETSDLEYLREKILTKLSKEQVNKTRLLGSAAISYSMLASGSADALIFAQPGGARTIDSPAGFLIAREAGCVFSNVTEGVRENSVENIDVGFSSRANLIGAANTAILSYLEETLVKLP
jgi:myo-inositol-1(or 4)-monophosphatase